MRKAKSETQTDHLMEENGKRKITGIYEDHWVTTEKVNSTMKNLKPKRCYGHDRIPLIYLRDGHEELTEVVTTIMSKIIQGERIFIRSCKVFLPFFFHISIVICIKFNLKKR